MDSLVWKKIKKMPEGEIKEIYRGMVSDTKRVKRDQLFTVSPNTRIRVHQVKLAGATLRTN